MLPAQNLAGFGRIADQAVDLHRPEIARIDDDEFTPSGAIEPALIRTAPGPVEGAADMREGPFYGARNRTTPFSTDALPACFVTCSRGCENEPLTRR